MGKHKHKKAEEEKESEEQEVKEADVSQVQSEDTKTYEELVALMAPIAKPLASKKLTRKLYKAVRKAHKAKRLKRGVREVVKGLRKDEKGVVVLAGDVSPIDVISHIPVFCEEKEVHIAMCPRGRIWEVLEGQRGPLVLCSFNPVTSIKSCTRNVTQLLTPFPCQFDLLSAFN